MIQFNLSFLIFIYFFLNIWFIYDIIDVNSKFYKEQKYAISYIYFSSISIIVLGIIKQYFNLLQIITNIPLIGNIFSVGLGIFIFLNLYYLQVIVERLQDNSSRFKKYSDFTKKIINYYSNLSYLYLILFTVITYYFII